MNGPAMKTDMTNVLRRGSTLVYDGDCSFCRRWVDRIARRDRSGTFEFVARQTEGLTKRFPKLVEGDFNTGMRLITSDDAIHVGADAAYQIVRRLRVWRGRQGQVQLRSPAVIEIVIGAIELAEFTRKHPMAVLLIGSASAVIVASFSMM